MLKPTEMGIKLDLAQFECANKLIQTMYKKILEYNKEVAKSNRLLKEQEILRKKLNVSVKNGKTIGLAKEETNG